MIRFRVWNTECRLHILTVLAAILASMLGLDREIIFVILAVSVHESAHLAAAKICGMDIEYIEIMCFGGAAKLRNLYSANRLKLVCVALAGPAANLLLSLGAASLAWWGFLRFYTASAIVRTNLILMFFNLMPALPLDGGRILFAVSAIWLPERIALRICAAMSAVLSLFLIILCIHGWLTLGSFNITLVLMAVFVIASALRELDEAGEESLENTLAALSDAKSEGIARVALLPQAAPMTGAAVYFDRKQPTIFAIADNGIVREFITSDEMARRILELN